MHELFNQNVYTKETIQYNYSQPEARSFAWLKHGTPSKLQQVVTIDVWRVDVINFRANDTNNYADGERDGETVRE